MLLSADTSSSIAKSLGLGIIGFADAIQDLSPDLIVILGDRYEMLGAASTALFFQIPVAHSEVLPKDRQMLLLLWLHPNK